MKLNELIKEIQINKIYGEIEKDITGISYDSRKTIKGNIFVCKGVFNDGHKYAKDAYIKGARTFIIEKELEKYFNDSTYIFTSDTKKALSLVSRKFYNFPEEKINTIAVTGTKGKTTSTYMIKQIFDSIDNSCGLIGTVYNIIGEDKIIASRTTPEALEIQKYLYNMTKKNQKNVALEISSHALDLKRVWGMNFDISIFTNLSQDHLDYHENMEKYFLAKRQLFLNTKKAIINTDDEYGKRLFLDENIECEKYSISLNKENASFYAKDIKQSLNGTTYTLVHNGSECVIKMSAYGIYNVYNSLGAIASCFLSGVEVDKITDSLLYLNVPGRQEKYNSNKGYGIFIDYAHSPASLESILSTFNEFKKGRLICVFGAGGDRDNKKRPKMGKVSGQLADISIITTDNPRCEKPEKIIEDIIKGIKEVTNNYKVIVNRTEAIKYALKIAKKNDIIVLAGKGHETYQEINGIKYQYDERDILNKIYRGEV